MTDVYALWREEMAGATVDRDGREDIAGFYRIQGARTKHDTPVALWPGEDGLLVKIGRKEPMPFRSEEAQDFICGAWFKCGAVAHDDYRRAMESGTWADGRPSRRGAIGGNSPPENDSPESLGDQIDAACGRASGIAPIDGAPALEAAQSARARLNELAGHADKRRKADKEPHLEAGRAVDAAWGPMIARAKGAAAELANAMGAYLNRADSVPDRVSGKYGRAASVREVKAAVIEDPDAVYAHFRENAALHECLTRLANDAASRGEDVPGCAITILRKVV